MNFPTPPVSTSLALALALAPLAGPGGAAPQATDEDALVHWDGQPHGIEVLPDEVPEPARRTTASWAEWAGDLGYRIDLERGARALVLTPLEDRPPKRELELLDQAVARFEELLPAPQRSAQDLAVAEVSWGVGQRVPDRDPVVLVQLRDETHYASLIDQIERTDPYVGSLVRSARDGTGFIATALQTGAWIEAPQGIEIGQVWRTDNELVHRAGRLLLDRRFGDLPHWLSVAVGWKLELDLLDSIYSFPGRDEFVGVGEHAGWEKELGRTFKHRKDQPLEMSELTRWRSGTWDAESAQLAWGLVEFLARHRPEALSAYSEALRLHHKEHSRVTHDDGSWELVPGYQVPPEAQRDLLLQTAGDDVLEEAGAFFRSWKRYRPGRD